MDISEPSVIEQRHDEYLEVRRLSSTPQNAVPAVRLPRRRRRFRFLIPARDWFAAVLFYALWPILVLMSLVPFVLWLLGAKL